MHVLQSISKCDKKAYSDTYQNLDRDCLDNINDDNQQVELDRLKFYAILDKGIYFISNFLTRRSGFAPHQNIDLRT